MVPTICDGDCGLDVMNLMLGLPSSLPTRSQLRVEMSDYLLERAEDRWMLEMLVAAQELDGTDVALYFSNPPRVPPPVPPPVTAVAAALADAGADGAPAAVDDETIDAMRWATRLSDSASVLSLIQNLPAQVVAEQVVLYRGRDTSAVAGTLTQSSKIPVGNLRSLKS